MPTYLVTWEIELDADSPRQAAEKALRIHRDVNSTATCFTVQEFDTPEAVVVDLQENEQ